MSLSRRPLLSADTGTALSALAEAIGTLERTHRCRGNPLRALFLARTAGELFPVADAAMAVWAKTRGEAVPEPFPTVYDMVKTKEPHVNYVVLMTLIMIITAPAVWAAFSTSPMFMRFLNAFDRAFDKGVMGLTEDGDFCTGSHDRMCNGAVELVQMVRVEYLII